MKRLRLTAAVLLAVCYGTGVALADPPRCPPGQAKKGNCVLWYDDNYWRHDDRGYEEGYRDGLRDAHWEIGHRLPRETHYVVVRDYDRYHLRPPPRGHYYAEVDGRILLVEAATQLVLEALSRH